MEPPRLSQQQEKGSNMKYVIYFQHKDDPEYEGLITGDYGGAFIGTDKTVAAAYVLQLDEEFHQYRHQLMTLTPLED